MLLNVFLQIGWLSLILLIISALVDLLSSCMIDAPTLSVRSFLYFESGVKRQQGGREVEGMGTQGGQWVGGALGWHTVLLGV